MDRNLSVGFLGAVLAICPLAAGAQPAPAAAAGPKVFAQAGPSPSFKFYAGSEIDDVARTTDVPEMLTRIGLRDPSAEISLAIAKEIAKRKVGSVVGSAPADYTVTVTSTDWTAGFYVPFRPTYNLRYGAQLTVTDASGTVIKSATCQENPDDSNSAGSNSVLLAHGGRKLKEIYAKATASCEQTFMSKIKSL